MTPLRETLQRSLGDTLTIERELGGGGMSHVFVARDRQLNRLVVVKVLGAEIASGVSVDRFAREIHLAASLQQANIVPLLAAGEADGVPYFTMPFVEGESLRSALSARGALPIAEALSILRDVARALSYAHSRGVVHRDIKPDNVLLSHGAAVVTDFGIAKAVSASRTLGDNTTLTQAGLSLGTPAYMAPEQVAGDPTVGPAADLYAWGCLATEVLAGAPPFQRDSVQKMFAAHLTESPASLASRRDDIPDALQALVARCLEKDASNRPSSAAELLTLLDAVYTPTASPSRTPAPTRASGTMRRVVMAAAVLAVLALVGITWRQRSNRGAPSSSPSNTSSIAVLPLANLSGEKADEFFGIGLSEEMTRALAKTGVRVIGRTSAGALQAQGRSEAQIAEALGVGALLTGSVQRAAGQVRINVTLLSATGEVRWTEKYDRPIANLFALQDEIASAVAGKLLGALGMRTRATRVETQDAEAYADFLQGQVLFNRRSSGALLQSISLFEQAVRRDPKFARAYGMLAVAQSVLPHYTDVSSDSAFTLVRASAARALAIDSAVAEAYTALAWMSTTMSRNRAADTLFRKSLAIDSTVATTWGWYGLLASRVGDFRAAHERVAVARRLEPAMFAARTWEAQVLLCERRDAEAEAVASSVVALDSTFAIAVNSRAYALLRLGRVDEAIKGFASLRASGGVRTADVNAELLAAAGRRTEAAAELAAIRAANGGRYPPHIILVPTLEMLGQHDEAVAVFKAGVAAHDPWLVQNACLARYDVFRKDPKLAPLFAAVEAW